LLFICIFSICFSYASPYQCFAPPLKQDSFDDRSLLFSNHNNYFFAEKIANYLGVSLAASSITKDTDGQIQIHLEENVKNKNVIILPEYERHLSNMNDHLLELYLFVRATKRASAASITAILPYYEPFSQYSKQLLSSPISSTDISLFLEVAGVDRVITLDLYSGRVQGFFRNIPLDNLYTAPMFVPYFVDKDLGNVVIVSLDSDGEEKARKFAESLEYYAIPAKVITIDNQLSSLSSIKGADVILLDEICGTANPLVQAASLLQEQGANRIFAVVTHPIFTDHALEVIGKSNIDEMVIADTLTLKESLPSNVRFVRIPSIIGSMSHKNLTEDSLLDWLH
jgi:ribose-phosphate pyrophosphokinase